MSDSSPSPPSSWEGAASRRLPALGLVVAVAVQLVLLGLAQEFVRGVDLWIGFSVVGRSYFVVGGFALLLQLLPRAAVRHRATWAVPAAWCAFLLWLPLADSNALKPLLRGAEALTPGMGREEVLATLNEAYDGTRFEPPQVYRDEADHIGLKPVRDPRHGGVFSAESLHVVLRDGRFERYWFAAD